MQLRVMAEGADIMVAQGTGPAALQFFALDAYRKVEFIMAHERFPLARDSAR